MSPRIRRHSDSAVARRERVLPARSVPGLAVLVALFVLMLAPDARAAWPHDPSVNLAVASSAGNKSGPREVADGSGGAIVAWADERSGVGLPPGGSYWDIYAHHVLANGTLDPGWPAGGLAVCTASDNQQVPRIASDGAGGAIVVWQDLRNGTIAQTDIYAQHVLASGVVDPAWPVNGRELCAAANTQSRAAIVPDGSGGAIAAWSDYRASDFDIYAQHVLASGAVDPAWPADGRALCTQAYMQYEVALESDGAGGAIATWEDYRNITRTDVYAQHVLTGGAVDPAWPVNGLAVCTAAGEQSGPPAIVSDGSGGGIVAWCDYRGGSYADIYAQHVLATGTVDPAWAANGVALCTATNEQVWPIPVADGAGGAVVAWLDHRSSTRNDVYAQHVLGRGVVDPAWTANGVNVCAYASNKAVPAIAGDGAGGALLVWEDARGGGTFDLYAQHVLSTGALDSAWPVDGQAVSTAANTQYLGQAIPDGTGGFVAVWMDSRITPYTAVYAQRVAHYGVVGTPEAEITAVTDVPADQGLHVRVQWNASGLDTLSGLPIGQYGVWRQVPYTLAATALARGAALEDARAGMPPKPGAVRAQRAAGVTTWWECVGMVPATGASSYTSVVQTLGDSITEWIPFTTEAPPPALLVFRVDAHAARLPEFWDSAPVAGYSLDNLAPSTPSPLTGEYAGGTTRLHWGRNREPDFVAYRVHRGDAIDFVPGPGNQCAVLADTGWADAAGAPHVYKLCAVDLHGNSSEFATLVPSGVTGVGLGRARPPFALAGPRPNPCIGAPLAVAITLPDAEPATLELLDVGGRRVVARDVGALGAGSHVVPLSEGGHLAPGLYLVRLARGGSVRTQRVVVIR